MAHSKRDLIVDEVQAEIDNRTEPAMVDSVNRMVMGEDAIYDLVMRHVDHLLAEVEPLMETIASQRAMLNNAEAVNAELMLEVANARVTADIESDMVVQNERLGREVSRLNSEINRLRQVVDDQSTEIANCEVLKYEDAVDVLNMTGDVDRFVERMKEIRRG